MLTHVLLLVGGCLYIPLSEVDARLEEHDSGDGDGDGDGFSVAQGDCDDEDADISPTAEEDCGTADDDNCDGDANDPGALGCVEYHADSDGDGFGGPSSACLCVASSGFPESAGDDCDDGDPAANPGEAEVCDDGVDNDCDGSAVACRLDSASLTTAIRYAGEVAAEHAGLALGPAGDVNGDGYDDFVVGAPNDDGAGVQAGTAYLVLGSSSPVSLHLSAATTTYIGESGGDAAGGAVSGVGDVNGDGYGDLVIGAVGALTGRTGAAYLVLGSASPAVGSVKLSVVSAARYDGELSSDYAGVSVSGAGDVNADGFADLLVGAEYFDGGLVDAGAAYLVLGQGAPASESLGAALRYTSEDGSSFAGRSTSGAGDVDGDGYDDFLVGAYRCDDAGANAGAAYLVLGDLTPTSQSLSASVQYRGEVSNDNAGWAVGGPGDVNGDGYADVLVGAENNSDSQPNAGAAYLVYGGANPAPGSLSDAVEYTGSGQDDLAGYSLAGAGDMDADGYDDFIVGALSADAGAKDSGAAYLVFGAAAPPGGSLSATVQLSGEAEGDLAGCAVSSAGDVDGDGNLDLLVGGYSSDATAVDAGAAYLVLGVGL